MLGWLDAREAKEFGNALAVSYDEKFRASQKVAERKLAGRQQKVVSEILSMAVQFGHSHRLNVYQKAKLGNAFKWKLNDLGHDRDLVEQLTKDIMLALR